MLKSSRYTRALLEQEYREVGLPSPVKGSQEIHHLVEQRGTDIVNLSIMTDQTPPPDVRIAAAQEALKGGYIKNALFVREKIAEYYEKENGTSVDPRTGMYLTTGSQAALDSAFKLLIEPGDTVLIAEPEYATYEPMIHFYGGTACFAPLALRENAWGFDRTGFKEAITKAKPKLVVLSNPNNPAGYIYRREDLEVVAELAIRHSCWLLSDEIWSVLMLRKDLPFVSMGAIQEVRDRLVITFSSSKAFGMSGYRTGVVMGPAEFISAMDQVVRFSAQAAPTIGQVAFAEALDLNKTGSWIEERREALRLRVRSGARQLNEFPGVRCAEPESGVFLFPDISGYGMTSLEFASCLVKEEGVYVLPGYFYGRHCDSYVRISMAVPQEDYEEGMRRLMAFLRRHG